MLPTLAKLVTQRSQFADELTTFVEEVGATLAIPPYYPKGFKPAAIAVRQQVMVSRERLRYRDEQARRLEADRRSGYALLDAAHQEEQVARAYQRRGAESYSEGGGEHALPTIVDWENVRTNMRRAIILGDPGFGKTWLLYYEAYTLANLWLASSADAGIRLLPIYLRLAEVAQQLDKASGNLTRAIVAAAKLRYHLSDRLIDWLSTQVSAMNTVLLLDALDEVETLQRALLLDALQNFAGHATSRILITSRLVGYQGPPFVLRHDDAEIELEIVAFGNTQVRNFVRMWFTEAPAQGQALLAHLNRQPTLYSLARIPILLSFICMVAVGNVSIPTTRAALYEKVLRHLLEVQWRPPILRQRVGRIDRKLRLLERIAWHFATAHHQWIDLFPGDELDKQIENDPEAEYLWRIALSSGERYSGLLNELSEQDGILVTAGAPLVGTPLSQVPYLFLHRTIHEYLVARHLAAMPSTEWLAHIQKHWWFDADWTETIVLLAGCLDNPNPLISALLAVGNLDPFHHHHLLAARCISEAKASQVDLAYVQVTVDHLHRVTYSASKIDFQHAIRGLAMLGKSGLDMLAACMQEMSYSQRAQACKVLAQYNDERGMKELKVLIVDEDDDARKEAIIALGEIGDPATIPHLVAALDDDSGALNEESDRIPDYALRAIGQIGDPVTVPYVISAFDRENVNEWAIYDPLKQLGNPAFSNLILELEADSVSIRRRSAELLVVFQNSAVPYLISALNDHDAIVRIIAVDKLGFIGKITGNRIAVPHLISALQDEESSVRAHAAEALGKIGDPAAVPHLISRLYDQDRSVRQFSMSALGEIGDPAAVPHLISALNDDIWNVNYEAAKALRKIGDPAVPLLVSALHNQDCLVRQFVSALGKVSDPMAVPYLISALQDEESSVRAHAAEALGKIGDPAAVPHLISRLYDQDRSVRQFSMSALGEIGDPAVVPHLISALQDEESSVRAHAAEALGKIGDPAAVPHLIGMLDDKDNLTLYNGAIVIGERNDSASIRKENLQLNRDRSALLSKAATALAKIDASIAIPYLIAMLDHRDIKVRNDVLDTLGQVGELAIPGIVAAIGHQFDRQLQIKSQKLLLDFARRGQERQILIEIALQWPSFGRYRWEVYELLFNLVWQSGNLTQLQTLLQSATDFVLIRGRSAKAENLIHAKYR